MTTTVKALEAALLTKAPDLHANLAAQGQLRQWLREKAEEIDLEATAASVSQRNVQRWDNRAPGESGAETLQRVAGSLRMATNLQTEQLIADAVEALSRRTSGSSPD